MSFIQRAINLSTWPPPTIGEPCHPISLTSDDGTWVKLSDFEGHLNVVFLVFDSLSDETIETWLQSWNGQIAPLDSLETIVFGINTARTDELRQFRQKLKLDFHLLYDPLAIESRALRCSSRISPTCKTTVIGVSKTGSIVFSERGQAAPSEILDVFSKLEGRSATPIEAPAVNEPQPTPQPTAEAPTASVSNIDSDKAEALINEKNGGYILIDVRTRSEYEADHSPHAVHIPIDELPHRHEELAQTKRIICVCQAGGRSAAAAEFLTSIGGTEIYNVEGGMSAWSGERVTGGQLQS